MQKYLQMKAETQDSKDLTIIHFNDVYDIEPNPLGQFGFANFYDFFLELRKEYPDSLVVFSGDAFAPSKLTKVRKGWQMVHCLKMLNIDVACYGNHQFDFPLQHTMELANACQFPWLLSNVKNSETNRNLGEGLNYLIIQRMGFTIGLMGLAGPDFKGRLISCYKDITQYQDYVVRATQLCQKLRSKGCNLIIALTHMRLQPDQILAKKVPGIDLILGGHDHIVFSKLVNKIPILKSGSNFQHIGLYKVVSLEKNKNITYEGRRWSFQTKCLPIAKAKRKYNELEAFISEVVQQYKQRGVAKPTLKKDVHILPQSWWKFKFAMGNGRTVLNINSKQKSEICFAKYVCFERKIFMGKIQQPQICDISPIRCVIDALTSICSQIKRHKIEGKTIYYGEGESMIPYLIQTTNAVYLPNQIECLTKDIKQVTKILKKTQQYGVNCYAIIDIELEQRRNSKQKSLTLCPTIKFVDVPKMYSQIISQNKGADLCELVFEKQYQKFCFINQQQQVENQILIKITDDQLISYYINYIDCLVFKQKQAKNNKLQKVSHLFKRAEKGKQLCESVSDFELQLLDIIEYIKASKQISMYYRLKKEAIGRRINLKVKNFKQFEFTNALVSYELGYKYRQLNFNKNQQNQFCRGLVFNENGISNPTYQLGYGYLPILFSTTGCNLDEESLVLSLIKRKQELEKTNWFNLSNKFEQFYHPVYGHKQKVKQKKGTIVLKNKRAQKTSEWVTKYAKKSYENILYVKMEDFMQILKTITENQQD